MEQRYCEQCGEAIPYKSHMGLRYLMRRFCSRDCRDKGMVGRHRGPQEKPCVVCGVIIHKKKYSDAAFAELTRCATCRSEGRRQEKRELAKQAQRKGSVVAADQGRQYSPEERARIEALPGYRQRLMRGAMGW